MVDDPDARFADVVDHVQQHVPGDRREAEGDQVVRDARLVEYNVAVDLGYVRSCEVRRARLDPVLDLGIQAEDLSGRVGGMAGDVALCLGARGALDPLVEQVVPNMEMKVMHMSLLRIQNNWRKEYQNI